MTKLSLGFVAPVAGIPSKWHGVYANSITVNGKKHEFKDQKGEVDTQWAAVQTVCLVSDDEAAEETQSPEAQAVFKERIEALAKQVGWASVCLQAQASIDLQCSKKFRDVLAASRFGSDHLNATQAFIFADQVQPYFGELCTALATRADTKPILERAFAEHGKSINTTAASDPNVKEGKAAFDATRK